MRRIIPFALLALVVLILAQQPPTNDAAWQLWIGRQLADGQQLYRDIVEINPPLWFWLAVPVTTAASLVGITANAALVGFLGLAAALSIGLVLRASPGESAWIPFGLVFAFFVAGISATGQREQYTLIAVTPYVFLAAARADSRLVGTGLAFAAGLFAASGIALKHYFALVPIALELWLLLKGRWTFRPELGAMIAGGLAYVFTVALVAPDYWRNIVPLVRASYGGWDAPLAQMVTGEVMAICVIALFGVGLVRRRSSTVEALAVAGAAFLLVFLVQHKGFRYHGLPAIGLFSIMAFVAIAALAERRSRDPRSLAAIIVLALVPLLATATTIYWRSGVSPARHMLCAMPRGSMVLVLTASGNVAWPAVETCQLRWASRYMFLWMLPEIERDPERHAGLARTVRTTIAQDMARYRPDLVLVEDHAQDFVLSSAAIRSQLAGYQRSSNGGLLIFKKAD